MVRTAHPAAVSARVSQDGVPVPHGLSLAIATVLGAALPITALAQTVITTDGRTATSVTTAGTTRTVTTSTVRGSNAFNSFDAFKVGAGDTVNLHLPGGTQNLINLVWDEQVSINGLLNSYKGAGTGTPGGRVFFAAPGGFVVGSTGVLNVGALSVATPRADEMLRLGAELGGLSNGAFEALIKGELKPGTGTVSIAGRVNALDDVRIQAHAIDVTGTIFVEGGSGQDRLDSAIAVNSGGSVQPVRLVNDGNNIVLVADESVAVNAGGTLRANGGDVLLQGNFSQDILKDLVDDGAVRVDGTIDTRRTATGLGANPAAAAISTGASGNVLLAGKDISVGATGMVNASANGGQTAGDVNVEARALDGAKMGWVKAESSATIDGTLTGRNVSVTAQSTANSVWDFEKDIDGVESLPALAIESVTSVMGVLGIFDVGLLSASAKATVTIADNAVLRATDDVTVKANTIADVQSKASARGNGLNQPIASISAAYGKVDADATVNVQAGAQLRAGTDAGDNVTIQARTDNTLAVSAVVLTTGVQPADAAIAVSEINADASVDVARGVVITGDAVDIRAHTENSLTTKATATSDKDGVAGISAAATVQDINARANNSAHLSGIGSLVVDATNHSDVNATAAKVAVGKDGLMMALQQKKADLTQALFERMTAGLGSASGIIGQQNSGSGETKPFRFGSAMSYTDASHTASATLGAGTMVSATGDVTVSAQVVDEGLHQGASSAVASKAKEQNGADASLSFAIAYGKVNHDARAVIGQGAQVTADEIAVQTAVRLPLGITRAELESLPAFFEKLEDWAVGKLNPYDTGESEELEPPSITNPLSSMVSAKAKGEKLGIGGAVNYLQVTNNSNAWVDDGATLSARHVDVSAVTDIMSVHLAGKPGIASGGRAGVGGTFNNVIYDSTTLAGVGKGAVVTAAGAGAGDGTVQVGADSRNITYVVAPTSGEATSYGLTGMVSIADISDTTRASLSSDARVTARTVDVTAAQDALLVSAAGGFTKSESAAVGFTVAVNNLQSDVHAYVGDNAADARAVTGVDHAAAARTGWIASDALSVKADTTGESVAIAIAGTLAKNDDPAKKDDEKPGAIDKLKTSVEGAKKKLDDASKKLINELAVFDKLTAKVKGGATASGPGGAAGTGTPDPGAGGGTPPPKEPKPQPKFGLSVSGSAAVNMASQSTRATLTGATVKARSAGGTQDTTVQATNAAHLASASGAAAITKSKAPSSKFNGAMAGAVAYGLIDTTTEAVVTGSSLQDADDVAVRALNVGEHTVLGISVGVEASGSASKSASFSGSFSIADSQNDTRAVLDGSTLQAADVAGTGVDVTAYNRSRTGIGGGSLYVNTSTGSNANVGMAFTYAKIGGTTEAAQHGGRIDDADAVTIRAVDSALIGSAAAMGGGGSQANGLAGAFIWNEIGNTTRAVVDAGAVIDVDGDINISARASAPVSQLDALIAGGVTDTSEYDFSGSTLFANSGEAALPGTSIVSVAGLVQVGKNNIGVSFVGSKVDNTHEVSINGATLDAGTHKVDLKATDNTRIIAASVGLGVASGDFAGMGSATANMIGNTSRVAVTGATIRGGGINALAQDDSRIDAFAGNVTVSKSNAAGVAIGYNAIDNVVSATVTDSTLDTKGEGAAGADGAVSVDARSNATILAGAVAGAVSKDVAIGGSFGWTETTNSTRAEIETSVVQAGTVDVRADNDTDIKTLSGGIAFSKDAAIGAAINTVLVGDSVHATLDRVNLDAAGAVTVDAGSEGSVMSMAVAGSGATNVALSGSNNNAAINNTVEALAHGLTGTGGARASALTVKADNRMDIDTLAGAVSGAQGAAVGGAIGLNLVGGRTSALLTESQLAVTGAVIVDADSRATIDTLSVSAAGAGQGAFTGAMTTNNISSTVEAGVRDTGSSVSSSTLSVTADDASRIQSLAAAAAGAGNAGVGASIAVNRVGTTLDAFIEGGDDNRTYNAADVTVAATATNPDAGTGANIRTVAVGVGGGGDVGGAGSLAVNLLDADVKSRIDSGARVTAQNNVAVLAKNQQGIDVLAGALAIGGTAAGVGLGLVVNHVSGDTIASIAGSGTQVNALALGAGRSVSSGALANPSAVDVSDITSVDGFVSPDLSMGTRTVNGVAVNATNQQNIATAGGSAALTFNPTGSFAVAAIAGTNIIGGTTRASIDGASINQLGGAASDQQVDVRAGSHAMNANFIVGAAGGASTVGATAAVATNVFASDTEASIKGAQVKAAAGATVDADASHNAVALSVGLAGGLVGGAGSVSMNLFDTRTRAFVHGGSLTAGSLFVEADSTNRVNLIAGAGAAGGVGVAGSFLINIGSSDTYAYVGDAGSATTVNVTGALDVDASSTSVMKGVAVSGAAGGAAGVAGMAGVSVLANATKAWVSNATTTSGTLDVSAHDTLDLSSYAGALGLSSNGYGVGAAANVAVLANTTSAQIIGSSTTTTGKTTVDATTARKIDAVTVTAGVGGTAGIGGAASLLLVGLGDRGDSNSELDKDGTGTLSQVGAISNGTRIDGAIGTGVVSGTERDGLNSRARFNLTAALAGADDSTTASIATSTVRASAVDVDADAKLGIRHITGAGGAGALGLGGAMAYTGVYDATRATITGSTITTTATSGTAVRVDATSGDLDGAFVAGDARAYAGGAGLTGLGAALAVVNVDRITQASVGGTLNGASGTSHVAVNATDTSTVRADATGAAAGAAAGGIVVATAKKTSDVTAAVSAAVNGHRSLAIDANSSGNVAAQGYGASAGLIGAGTGVGVTATDESVVRASSSGAVALTGGDASIRATATPNVDADAFGVTVAGNVGLGAAVAMATANVDVGASMSGTLSGTGSLTIAANVARTAADADTARAKAVAGTGGFLVGANATYAEAANTSKASATTGSNSRLSRGNTVVTANVDTRQSANATGVAVGALALGASVSKATSSTTTIAALGNGTQVTGGESANDVTVRATGTDRNIANVTAGAGGVVSGNAARADTSSTSTTTASIGDNARLRARKVDVSATHDSRYAGQANSVNASFVGASGAGIGHVANATVSAGIGANADVSTVDDIRIAAQNQFHSDNTGASVSAAGGGVLNGSAALVDVSLTGITNASVGAGAKLATGLTTGANGRAGDIHVLASTLATTSDSAELTTGGAIDVAVVKARALGNFVNNASVGDYATLDTLGYINIGSYTKAALSATALVNTWGLAAVGVSDADVDVISDQNVTIGTGASLEAFRNVYVTAGRDSRNLFDTLLQADATSQGYVRGLIAVPSSSAEGHTSSTADLWIKSGSDLTSTSNVTAGAYTGAQVQAVDGTGHGYQLGFIPVTQRDSSSGSAGAGTVAMDGTLTAGKHNTLAITIDAAGTLTQHSGLTVAAVRNDAFNPRAFLETLTGDCITNPVDGCKGLAALKNSVANSVTGSWALGPMFAGGGDVFLHGDVVNGAGTAIAKGAPTITVTNNSNRALLLDEITLPDYAGGNVRFTGKAGTAGGVVINQAPSSAMPTVTIHNAGTASNPGAPIFTLGDITNLGGLVRLRNDEGSLGMFATVYAQQQIVEAPNGIVTFNNIYAPWFSGSTPRADWLGWGRPGNPNEVVAYIANDHYDASGTGLIYRAGGGGYAGASVLPWGGCLPHNTADSACSASLYPFGHLDFAYDGGRGAVDMPNTPHRALFRSAGYSDNPSVASNAANSSFVGQQIYVRAQYIDVNSTIDAGAGTNWSLKLRPEMQAWVDALGGAQGLFDIPAGYVTVIDGGSRLIKARYDATNRRIVVDNVNASGGGYVFLDGRIVSSTPHGKVKVSSGYGKVAIDSAVNLPVQVNDINVGNGAVGVVEIVDRQKPTVFGNPFTTWYVSRQGQGTQAYNNSNGATSYEYGAVQAQTGSYNPQAGMRYSWTDTARVGRGSATDAWGWVDSTGKRVDAGQQWTTTAGGFYQDGNPNLAAFQQQYVGTFTDIDYAGVSYGCSSQWGGCNYGFPVPAGGNHWSDSRKGWETWWMYARPLQGTLTLQNSVKADNAIAIDFSGNAIGTIDVRAQGDLFVNGRLNNSGGNTSLTTVASAAGGAGHVTQSGNTASVTARNLRIASGAGVGSAGNFFQATLTDNGSLDASSTGWGQYVRLLSGGAVRMLDAGFGAVMLDANGSITGINGATRDFSGGDITLTSRFGSLGSLANPLDLDSREFSFWGFRFGGRVNASALGDIGLTDHSGDFAVNKVVSETGNVRLEAAAGNLTDARERTGSGVLDEDQRKAIWTRLKLDGSGVAASVAAYEAQVVARYQEFWRLLDVGTVSQGTYTLATGSIALFRPLAEAAAGRTGLSDAEVNAYAAGRYAAAGETFATAFGSGWASESPFQSRQVNFTYTLDTASQQYAEFAKNATWTEGQLKFAINANALEPASGAVGQADPNVVGRNVTLVARDNVGRLAADRNIAYTALTGGTLNDDEAVALALANAPGDVLLVRADGYVYSRADLLALTQAQIAAGAIAHVRVKQTSPLFVQVTGKLNGSAGQSAYLQANDTLALERFTTVGNARLAATGSIVSARTDGAHALQVGGDLVLLAGNGRIGASTSSTDTDPLVTAITGRLLSASAGQDVRLRDTVGDLHLGTVFANGTIGLQATAGGIVSVLDGLTLDGQSITLSAAGDIGHRKAAAGALEGGLKLRVGATGALSGSTTGSAWFDSPDRALQIGTFTASGALRATAGQNDLTAGDVTSGGQLTLGAGEDLVVGTARSANADLTAVGDVTVGTLDAANATLAAGNALRVGTLRATGHANLDSAGATTLDANGLVQAASVDLDAASLAMGAGSRITAAGDITLDTSGDMQLGAVALTGNAAGSDITLSAGGRIDGNGDGQVNVTGGGNTALAMTARTGIGTQSRPLTVDIGRTTGRALAGDIHLQLPNGGRIDSLIADAGDIGLGAGGRLDLGLVEAFGALRMTTSGDLLATRLDAGTDLAIDAGGDVVVTALDAGRDLSTTAGGAVRLDSALAGRDAAVSSGTSTTLGTVAVGNDAAIRAGTTLDATTLAVGGDATLTSGTSTRLGTATVGRNTAITAGSTLDAGSLAIGGDADLTSGDATTITSLDVTGNLAAIAGATLAITDSTIGGNAALSATQAIALGTTSIGGDLDATAGTDVVIDDATVGGNATLDAGQDIVLRTAAVTGDLDATAGRDLSIATGTVGGNAVLDAGQDVLLGTATIAGNLAASAGRDLAATDLTVDGAATLASTSATRLAAARIGHDARITSGTSTTLGSVTTGNDVVVDAGSSLDATTLTVGNNATLASGTSTTLGTATVGRDAVIDAGRSLDAATLAVGNNATLSSGTSTTLGTATVGRDAVIDAGSLLDASSLTVGGNADLASGDATTITALDVTGNLAAIAGAALAITDSTVGGNAALSAAQAIVLGTTAISGDLDATAGSDVAIDNATVSGNAMLDAGQDIVLRTAAVSGSLDATAGRDLDATDLTVDGTATLASTSATRLATARIGGDARITSGTSTTLGTVTVGNDVVVDAGSSLDATMLAVGNDAALTSGTSTTLGTAAVGNNAVIEAGSSLDARTLAVAGDATLISGTLTTLGTATVGNNAAITAGSALDAGSLAAGGDADLASGDATTITSLDVIGDVRATAGATLAITDSTVGGTAALSATQAISLGTTSIGGYLDATAGTDIVIDDAIVAGNATLDAGQDVVLGTAAIAGSLDASAGRDLSMTTGTVGGNAVLGAGQDVVLGTATIAGNLAASAGRDLAATDLTVDGAATLASTSATRLVTARIGGDARITSGTLTTLGAVTVGSDLVVDAGSSLDATALAVGNNATLTSGTSAVLDTATIRNNAAITAGSTLDAVSLVVGGNADLTSGDATTITSLDVTGNLAAIAGGALVITDSSVGGNAALSATQAIVLGTTAIGGDLDATAGMDVVIDDATVGGNATLDAGQDIVLRTAAVSGSFDATAGRDLAATELTVDGAATLASASATRLATARIGGGARITSGTSTTLGTVTVGNDVAVDAGSSLDATALAVGNNATLTSGTSTTLGTVTVSNDAAIRTGTTLDATTLAVGGDATLTSGTSTTLGTATIGRNTALTAGSTLNAGSLAIGGNAALASGDATTITALDVTGNLAAIAGATLSITDSTVGGNAALSAAQAIVLGTAVIGGDLDATAGSDVAIDDAAVGGNAMLDAGQDIVLRTAVVGGNVDASADRDLSITTGNVGGDAALEAGQDATLGLIFTGGSLVGGAGRTMQVGTARVGGDATLAATTLGVADATVAGSLQADAADAMRVDRARIAGDADLRAGGTMTLGTIRAGNDLDAVAGATLRFAEVDGGRDVTLDSTGSDVLGGTARAGRHLRLKAARGIVADALSAGDNASLQAGAVVDVDLLQAGGDIAVVAGADVVLGDADAGRSVTLDAGEGMRLGRVRAGTDLAMTAGGDIRFDALQAGRDMALRSRRGDVVGTSLTAAGAARLDAARDVRVDTTGAAALDVQAGRDVTLDRYAVGGDVALRSGRDMRIGTGTSGGAQSLLIGGSLGFGTLSSDTRIALDASGGRIDGSLLVAPVAQVAARDAIALDMARIGKRLNMASDTIKAGVQHTGSGMLSTRLTGYRDGVARRIDLDVDARDGWLVETLAALQAELDTTATKVVIEDGFVGRTLRLDTQAARLWMDNTGATLRIADVQLLELDQRFRLVQTGVHTLTDAYVVRYSPGFRVEVPNYVAPHDWRSLSYFGESAIRFTTRTLNDGDVVPAAVRANSRTDALDEVVDVQGGAAVNIGAAP